MSANLEDPAVATGLERSILIPIPKKGSESESRSVVSDSETPWTVARQAPLFMGILQARTLEWVALPSSRY